MTVDGVKDVVKLYNTDASQNTSAYRTVIGDTNDGAFYDLGNVIDN